MLADWIERGLPCDEATLLTPSRTLRYSGMVPGWIAGQYDRDTGTVDVGALAERAGAKLVLDRCIALDPAAQSVLTQEHGLIGYDVASIDTGGVGRARDILGDDPRLIDIRPIGGFVERLEEMPPAHRIAVVGGGAGGTELAFALRNRAQTAPKVTFITGTAGLLPDHSSAVRRKVSAEMQCQGITIVERDVGPHDKLLADVDLIVAALGSAAPDWPRQAGLATDDAGFIAVDEHQRSTSHANLFAVGDVAQRTDRQVPHSGVHAVFAGPVLAANLRSVMAGGDPRMTYTPRWNNLYLLSTGRGEAIASYGPFAAQGRWVAKLKHWIDMRWITKYAKAAQAQ